ncbi:MAG: ABC transporter permease [Flavobacteriales bacterium]|nr:ABC transporter permease [Flavobacteriales bacterium]MCB9193425.1 ABC transporter permease [Flavobacteriales bacterium]
MNLPFLFARRYLLASRTDRGRRQNAINLITMISMLVIAVVTGAMVVVLSTLNGINDLVERIYSPFDQDLTITPAQGKTFATDSLDLASIQRTVDGKAASWVIQENVLLQCGDQQAVATMKGVQPTYLSMSRMADHMYSGEATLSSGQEPAALLGLGLKMDLDAPLDDGVLAPLRINAPVRGRKLSKFQQGAFERVNVPVSGAFTINMDFDTRYLLVSFDLAARVLHYDHEANALEIQLPDGADADKAARALRKELGHHFIVRTRYQKNALVYSTNASEKWFTFLVLSFIGLIGAFNIIASLTMMMIEKRGDMATLLSMGASPRMVRTIFLHEGLLIVGVGSIAGLVLGLSLCWVQQRYGLIALSGSVVDAYPVKVLWTDLLLVLGAVAVIGLVATGIPLQALDRRFLQATRPNGPVGA